MPTAGDAIARKSEAETGFYMPMLLTLMAVVLIAGSGVPGLFARQGAAWGQITATALTVLGAGVGIAGGWLALSVAPAGRICLLPGIWPGMPLHLRLDALSAFFTVLIFLMAGAGAVYGQGYWNEAKHPRTGRKLRAIYGLLLASMVMVTLAYDAIAFLMAWEIMALTSFFLIATEDHKPECRQAAWIYFVATHVGTLALFAVFALLHGASGTFLLQPVPVRTSMTLQTAIFLLALLGFGLKAGIMPLHFWLPGAHANAPSHISALLSGVLLKIGIYGLLRILTLLPHPPALWGVLVLILGATNAVLGVALALGQHDIKRLLAYHSIENIGIILMGVGLAMIGQAVHQPVWVVLGIAGGLLHVWNHGLFKSLLFLAAGSAIHGAHTREIDAMGGLAHRMSFTAGLFMVGAVAICGLPPLNGFISELLIYMGLLAPATHSAGKGWAAVAMAAVALSVVGALAVACFVKVFGAAFLGHARTNKADNAHEAPLSMIAPMWVLAGLCAAIGMAPLLVVVPLGHAAAVWAGEGTVFARVLTVMPWGILTAVNSGLAVSLVLGTFAIRAARRAAAVPCRPTWACGYARPDHRMQYTATSFAQPLVRLLRWALRPITHGGSAHTIFLQPMTRSSHVPDFVTDTMLFRFWQSFKQKISPIRRVQHGSVQRYLLYMMLALFVLLATLIPFGDLWRGIMGR